MDSPRYIVGDFFKAIISRRWDEVRCIISAQPQLVNERDADSMTLLFWMVVNNAPQNLLLEILNFVEEEVVEADLGHRSIVHFLAEYGNVEALRHILNISPRGVNLQDGLFYSNTPLHYLMSGNHSFRVHIDAAQVLIDAGADSSIKNNEGLTPMDKYMGNECREYDDSYIEEQKEELLQLLRDSAVPAVLLARREEAVKVFQEELEKGQVTVNHARLMVTGKEGVGKTCLVNTLLEKPINEQEPSTDGIVLTTAFRTTDNDCSEWKKTEDMDECERTKQMYDNAIETKVAEKLKLKGSQGESSAVAPVPVQQSTPTSASAPIPASEPTTDAMSEPTAADAMSEPNATENTKGEGDLPVNRRTSDVKKFQALPPETQKRIVNRLIGKPSRVIESEDIIYIWDFAGQQLYYITHRIFLTSEAVYLILFNLMESMHAKGKCRVSRMAKDEMTYDMTNIQIIKYWMRLIFTYAVPVQSQQQQQKVKKPQIALVGTHSESLPGTNEDKKKRIEEQFGIIFEEIKGTPYECHVVRKMYAIDNKSSSPSEMLKTLKQDVGGFLLAMPKTIPIKWLEFQRLLQEIGRKAVCLPYAEVCKVATKCGISVKNLIHALNYLHNRGIILYFENIKHLKDSVITNPRKLIKIFKKIITAVELDDDDKWPSMIKLWNKLDDKGILEEELVRHLWRDEFSKDETIFEVFLELMKQFGLLCEQIKNRESTQRSFFVPCRLKRSVDSMAIEPDMDQMVSIYMTSEDFFPGSVFHLLVVSLIGMVQDMGYMAIPELFRNKANIGLGHDHNLCLGEVVIDNKPSLKLEISRMPELQEDGTETPTGEPSPKVCMQVLEFLKQQLKVLTSAMKHTSYKFHVLCWTGLQEMHFHNLEECLMNSSIRCGKKLVKTSKLHRMFKNKLMTDFFMPAASLSNTEITPPDGHLGYLEDNHLRLISTDLGPEWKHLGVRLGLSWKKVKQICYPSKPLSETTMDMLTEWRKQQNYETNQVKIMVRALKDQKLTELAIKVFGSQMSEDQSFSVKADEEYGRRQQMRRENNEPLDDQGLLFICDNLGSGWRRLCVRLGLGWNDVNDIADDNRLMKDGIMEALVTWRDCQSKNQIQIMIKALRQQGFVQLAEHVCEMHCYKDEVEVPANQMSPPQVSTQQRQVQGYLQDVDLLIISEVMGRGWKHVARSLRIKDPEIEEVDMKFQRQMIEATLEILVRWRNRQGSNVNQVRVVKAALIENERKSIAEKLEELYISE